MRFLHLHPRGRDEVVAVQNEEVVVGRERRQPLIDVVAVQAGLDDAAGAVNLWG